LKSRNQPTVQRFLIECVSGFVAWHWLARVLLFNDGEVVMNRCHEPSWVRKLLVLSALAAGGVATLFVPPYREIAFVPQEEESVLTPAPHGSNSPRMSGGIEAKLRHPKFIRSNG
jgi:hypothetical protein